MTSAMLLLLYAGVVAAIRAAAIGLGRPLSRSALAAAFGLPLLFFLPGFFTATTPLPADHTLSLWPWHVLAEGPKRNANLNDLSTELVPWAKAVRMAYKEGSLPLRDRWNGCGSPLAANVQSAAFSPFTFLGLLLPLARAATLTGALKLALALAGMWLWLRELRVSDGAAVFGAVSFTFSMMMIPWLLFSHTAVICLWPWALFAIELLRDRDVSLRAFLLLLLVFIVWPLCGHIESVVLGSAFVALWLASRAALRTLPDFPKLAARILAAGLLAMGLDAFVLLPQALAIRASNRFALISHPFWSGDFSFLPRLKFWAGGLLTPLFPRIFGDEITSPMIAGGAGSFPEMALGAIGLVAWTLALCVLRPGSRRDRASRALLVPMVFGLGAAIDVWPFAEISGSIPLLRLMFPLRFFSFLAIGGAALAAFEADRLARDLRDGRKAWIFPAALAAALAGVACAAFPSVAKLHRAAGGWPSERHAWMFAVVVLLAVAATCALFGLRRMRADLLPAFLAILAAGALFAEGSRIYRFHSIAQMYPETPLVRFLKSRPPPFRVVGEGAVIYPDTNIFAGVEEVRTNDPMENRQYVDYLNATCGYDPAVYFKVIENLNATVLDFLNVRYLVSTPGRTSPAPKWTLVYSGADGTVFENADVFPRFFSTDPSRVLEVSDYRESTNRIAFHSRAPGDRSVLAVGSIVQDGGWSAREETGKPLSVARLRGPSPGERPFGRAGGLFLGVSIPPGEHDIVLDYSPPGFRIGSWISLAALLLAAACGARAFARRNRPPAGAVRP